MTPQPAVDTAVMDQAERRWERLIEGSPELESAVRLQRRLVSATVRVIGQLHAVATKPHLVMAPDVALARLDARTPLLRGERFPIPVPLLEPHLLDVCRILEAGGVGVAAANIHDTIVRGRVTVSSLLAASLARDERSIRRAAAQMGFASDLLWLVGDLAVGPFAHVLQQDALGIVATNDTVRDAWSRWDRGLCPVCGSWPALAETAAGERTLRCSFCGAGWQPPAACAYCQTADERFGLLTPDEHVPGRGLELCDACGCYLKRVEAGAPAPFPLLPIEDLATTALDIQAMDRGYARPALPDADLRQAPGCSEIQSV